MYDDLIKNYISDRYSQEDVQLAFAIINKNLTKKSYGKIKDISFLVIKIAEDLCKS